MPDYRLELEISPVDLVVMRQSDSRIVIRYGLANVAWVAFKPAMQNLVAWRDSFGLYASKTSLAPDSVIQIISKIPTSPLDLANPGVLYNLMPSGAFEATAEHLSGSHYGYYNSFDASATLTGGLLLPAQANEDYQLARPVNALPVSYHGKLDMALPRCIDISVLPNIQTGTIIPSSVTPTSVIDLTSSVSLKYKYDSREDRFFPA